MSWAAKAGSSKPAEKKREVRTGRMVYVPPPARAGAAQPAPSTPRMKYVPPPTDAGSWARPKDAQLRASRKGQRAGAHQEEGSVGMSGNDMADIMAKKTNYDIWSKDDVNGCFAWAKRESCRIPNKRVAKGGRLHKLINIICNNCEEVTAILNSSKFYQDAERDPSQPSGLELKKRFIAPLAKKVLNKVVEDERENEYDDCDSDDSDAMAM